MTMKTPPFPIRVRGTLLNPDAPDTFRPWRFQVVGYTATHVWLAPMRQLDGPEYHHWAVKVPRAWGLAPVGPAMLVVPPLRMDALNLALANTALADTVRGKGLEDAALALEAWAQLLVSGIDA